MVSKTTCKSVFLSRYKNISLSRGKFLKILNFKFLNLIVKRNLENSLYFHSASKPAGKASPHSLTFFFFFNFSLWGKIPKFLISSYFACYMGGDTTLIFYFIFYYWLRQLERFWQGWKSIRRCFLFIPSENWIGSSISPGEGGSSADSYYSLSFSR